MINKRSFSANKAYFVTALLIISGFAASTVAFGQTTSPSPSATTTPSPSPSVTVIPSAPPSTGMGGR